MSYTASLLFIKNALYKMPQTLRCLKNLGLLTWFKVSFLYMLFIYSVYIYIYIYAMLTVNCMPY